MKTIAHLNHIRKTYGTGEAVLSVLNDFSMEIAEGDFVAIQGRSGSGKTCRRTKDNSLPDGMKQPAGRQDLTDCISDGTITS